MLCKCSGNVLIGLRDLETKLAATRQAIDSFCDGGLEPPPIPSGFAFVPIQGTGGR